MIMAGPQASTHVVMACKISVALTLGEKPLVHVSVHGLAQTCVYRGNDVLFYGCQMPSTTCALLDILAAAPCPHDPGPATRMAR